MNRAPPTAGAGRPASSIVVRDVRWSDFDDLRETYYGLYDERETNPEIGITLYATRPSLDDEVEWFSRSYRAAIAGESIWLVAEVDGRAVGNCVVSRVGRNASSEQGHIGLLGILVNQRYRGIGVGSALLESTVERCRRVFEIVRLSVFSTNLRAKRLYERFGFRTIGRVPRHVKRGARYLDEDEMVLTFDSPPPPSRKS